MNTMPISRQLSPALRVVDRELLLGVRLGRFELLKGRLHPVLSAP